jgi:hypothetical protein
MSRALSLIDQFFAWGLIAVGVAHLATGLAIFKTVTEGWIWFMGTGAAAVGIGALNLARAWHGREGVGLNRLSFASNAVLLAIVGAYAATFADRLTWQVVLIPAVVAVPTALALAATLRR